MSKIGQEVFEAQEFAQENYNVTREEFVRLAGNAFNKPFRPLTRDTAIAEFDVIQNDLKDWEVYNAKD